MHATQMMVTVAVLMTCVVTAGGCYEETGSAPVQSQSPTPPQQQGPLTSVGQQPASSALGKAKRTAGNIADQAEQKSRDVANQADEMMNPKSPSSNEDPATTPN